MKTLLLTITLLSVVAISYGQNPLPIGQAQLNAGFGFSNYGVPVYLGFDYGAGKDITVGGEMSFRSYNENYNGVGYKHAIMGLSGNGNYHFNSVLNIDERFDFYAGLSVGFYVWSSPNDYPGDHSSGLGLGAQVGGRYYFSPKTAINLEVGGGNSFSGGKIGLTFRL